MKKAAIIGFGFMGLTHTLNILKIEEMELAAIVDMDLSMIDQNLRSSIGNISVGSINASDISGVRRYSGIDACLQNEDIDAVIICTHVNTHYELAKKALGYNANVFVEKPFCLDMSEAQELIDLAEEKIGRASCREIV